MELQLYNSRTSVGTTGVSEVSDDKSFIKANTKQVQLSHLQNECIIPVFAKDNETTISHSQFVQSIAETAEHVFRGEHILQPNIRASHPIKGRIPSAMGKKTSELLESDKTLYYERMAFVIEVPSITENIDGQTLSLTMGGIRAFNQENLYGKKSLERFKLFIGFKNSVCFNLCISTDGMKDELRVGSVRDLMVKAFELFSSFSPTEMVSRLTHLQEYNLSESQFAHLVGRARMFNYLDVSERELIPDLMLGDSQLNSVVKGYYKDKHFGADSDGSINLWKLYNLFTGANKSSYIDTFLEREAQTLSFTEELSQRLYEGESWYLP
jgi:hypothetical protein